MPEAQGPSLGRWWQKRRATGGGAPKLRLQGPVPHPNHTMHCNCASGTPGGAGLLGEGRHRGPARRLPCAPPHPSYSCASFTECAAPQNAGCEPHLALLVRSVCVPGMLSRTFSFQRRQPAPMVAEMVEDRRAERGCASGANAGPTAASGGSANNFDEG